MLKDACPEYGTLRAQPLYGGRKAIFWTDNPVGNMAYQTLHKLVDIGVLEFNENEKIRWNPKFTI